MLCDTCFRMLRHHEGLQDNRKYELRFDHHCRTHALLESAKNGCSICAAVARQLERDQVDLANDRQISLQAALAVVWGRQWKRSYYSLDFLLDGKWVRTFALRPKERKWRWRPRISGKPAATSSYSDEVFALAQRWASRCKCAASADATQEQWYPDRLLDLDDVRRMIAWKKKTRKMFTSSFGEKDGEEGDESLLKARVRLLENSPAWKAAEAEKAKDNRYVTLSHCWGRKGVPLRLVAGTREALMSEGVALEALPKTFRDAVVFAAHLEGVRYIWIDSLCIVQKSVDDAGNMHDNDWKTQSALMDKVYHKAYLNLSATTSSDSSGGLFGKRNPETLREDEVDLDVTDLLELAEDQPVEGARARAVIKRRLRAGLGALVKCLQPVKQRSSLKRCAVIDVSLWDDVVEHGAVNARGWVYQERLLAPRVLHFCDGQVAWECAERDCTERYPDGVPGLQLQSGVIVGEDRLKGLDPEREGKSLREARLDGLPDPDRDLPRLYTYELWKRMVETFSQKTLTQPGDKLMALAGVAKHFFETKLKDSMPLPKNKHPYVVGMWREYLESQLLWRVEPLFEDGRIFNNAKRHPQRAPSFSWAALDVPHGVVYGEFTDQDVFFEVKDFELEYVDKENEFGLLEGACCRLLLNARLTQIELQKLDPELIVPYGWRPLDGNKVEEAPFRDMYTNVYLDSPDSDGDVFEPGAKVFCMPATRGERTDRKYDRHLNCLILQLTGGDNGNIAFKRVGVARLSSYEEQIFEKQMEGVGYQDLYLY